MNQISKKLASSLVVLKSFQEQGIVAIQTKMLERVDRERLVKHGFIKEVMRGWFILSSPAEGIGESTTWYSSYWGFCADYLNERLGEEWCLSPEQSINVYVGEKGVPTQLLVRSPKGRNKPTELIHGTSLFDVRLKIPDSQHLSRIDGLRVYTLPSALVHCARNHFITQATQIRAALSMLTDASEVLSILLAGGHITAAGRLAGAFRNIGRNLIADNIIKGMEAADFKVKETDPFNSKTPISFGRREISPYVNRLRLMWAEMRDSVIENFPELDKQTSSVEQYLVDIDGRYAVDAYHSLSIEGYKVTHELIELVRNGDWNPEQSSESKQHLDAMAAKGYWDAFGTVKKSIERVLGGENAGDVLEKVHNDWYLALFGPSVAAGIIKQVDLAGYRTGPVYIKQSKHTPPSREAVREMMPALFDLIMEEDNAGVRVVLGHFMFVYIHPYFDGNGRMGRFIMNLMMASGGYPWLIVPVERRDEYMESLESASVGGDIKPFTKFLFSIASSVEN